MLDDRFRTFALADYKYSVRAPPSETGFPKTTIATDSDCSINGLGVVARKDHIRAAAAPADLCKIAGIGCVTARRRQNRVKIPLGFRHNSTHRSPASLALGPGKTRSHHVDLAVLDFCRPSF